ncbi:LysR family glycine cleavage system transcriptional activator [Paraburkholderia sp. BL18I3N2]|uniref:LysR substrate-binding domain-containing protein n=1 Tax=Paraburkholderia sp. BL18I3N2 TaxID=1938799 RepID=UPI000D080B0D|nr:LysR substrate-binding domain-containing protein [Paraburkholderia sp. BL18I3N2]PRX27303.1 LysR family glycine cleavage system transcriptional activator [Paraburkholderia sp. BL18I3N2]
MNYRLPPLLSLRAFEASTRHLSFTKAGEELHLTQGAISRQIRLLESFLGQKLFVRLTRKIELTPAGLEYCRSVQEALDIISVATRRAVRDTHRVITLDVLPTLATWWLMPRLAQFTEAHRDIEVRLISSIDPVNLHSEEADVAIRVGKIPGQRHDRKAPRIDLDMTEHWKGVYVEQLFQDVLVPVVSPQLVESIGPINSPEDLLQYRLINTASRRHAWSDWLAIYGLRVPVDSNPLDFGHFFMTLQAARDAKGIAIVPQVLLANYEGRDELVMPLPADMPSAGAYYLLMRESAQEDKAIRLLCDWLIREASRLPTIESQTTLVKADVPA